jgi:hypothetical protein
MILYTVVIEEFDREQLLTASYIIRACRERHSQLPFAISKEELNSADTILTYLLSKTRS